MTADAAPVLPASFVGPRFTASKQKLAVLQRNAVLGAEREALPMSQQRALDQRDLHVTPDHVAALRRRVGLD
jgi:hypothetical protein